MTTGRTPATSIYNQDLSLQSQQNNNHVTDVHDCRGPTCLAYRVKMLHILLKTSPVEALLGNHRSTKYFHWPYPLMCKIVIHNIQMFVLYYPPKWDSASLLASMLITAPSVRQQMGVSWGASQNEQRNKEEWKKWNLTMCARVLVQ